MIGWIIASISREKREKSDMDDTTLLASIKCDVNRTFSIVNVSSRKGDNALIIEQDDNIIIIDKHQSAMLLTNIALYLKNTGV
jgi:hypothetical protein